MNRAIIERLPRIEGMLRVVLDQGAEETRVLLESGQSIHLENRLRGKYPLEAIHHTQLLSSKSSVSHALAAVSALENYLQLKPTDAALRLRQVLLQLSTVHSHIHHFYWELLPDYLNENHFKDHLSKILDYFIGFSPEVGDQGDLSKEIGIEILGNVSNAAGTLNTLQKTIATIAGKYPVIMNLIPGGISNFSFGREKVMGILRELERIKFFIEVAWPEDVKKLIKDCPETMMVLDKKLNLISFGPLTADQLKDQPLYYTDGAFFEGKKEPLNELKMSESLTNTFYVPVDKIASDELPLFDLAKEGARTWIKGARYEGEPMLTGALARMLVTHIGGGSKETSVSTGQMIKDLGLTEESPNCIASRLLAEVFEGRFYLKAVLSVLLVQEDRPEINRKTSFDFSDRGTGTGTVEAPSGSLLHQVYIDEDRITEYRIVSAVNWNFSSGDDKGKTGVVERELNRLFEEDKLTVKQACRILHSYNAQVLDGTQ